MLEIIGEFITLVLCQYPGAFIRWIVFRKRPFKSYLQDDWDSNVFAVVILIAAIVGIYNL